MSEFIELSLANGHAALFNVDHIIFITPFTADSPNRSQGENSILLLSNGDPQPVTENIREIIELLPK